MEIMNYNQMLENANAVKALVDKTIECSKDYTDIKSDDVLEQIAEYIAATISDILHDPICLDPTFRSYAASDRLSFANYGGSGEGAQAQFFFAHEGAHLRLYFNTIGHWWADKKVTDNGLKSLIKQWPDIKQQIDRALKRGINQYNERLASQLSRQLELHDAIKNFKV
jgi:hypothetical protein